METILIIIIAALTLVVVILGIAVMKKNKKSDLEDIKKIFSDFEGDDDKEYCVMYYDNSPFFM
jgi:hypothetical protein